MRRCGSMLARHVRELSRAAPPRAAPRAPSLPAFAARPPARPAPPRARPYHSRWALSVYGPEPGTPPEDLVGYEEELAEFERNKDELRRGMADGGGETRGDEAASRADRSPSTADAHATNADDERRWAREHADVVDLNAWATGANVAAAETAARRRSAANASVSSASDPGTSLRDDDDARDDPAAVSSSESTAPLRPGLYLVGTPIGNLEDITLRALRVLRTADAILAEDTRHTARLLRRYGIETRGRLVSYHAHNLRARRDGVIHRLRGGDALALVSDAGTPAVADPGADLAAACAEEGLAVVPVPGPCAPAAAVGAAGLWGFATSAGARRANDREKTVQSSSDFLDSSDDDADDDDRSRGDAEEVHRSDAHDAACDDDAARSVGTPSAPPSIDREGFTFVGFLPPKPGPRKKRLRLFADAPGAVVAFVPPHKLVATLEDCAEVFGAGRRCAVCREMTKVHEEFWRGTLESAASEFASREGGARGEITLVIEGVSESSLRAAGSGAFGAALSSAAEAAAGPRSGRAGLEASIAAMLADGASPSEAARRAVAEHGARRKEAYALAQRLKSKAADEEEEEEE